MTQNAQNFCLWCFISQEPYIIRFSFLIHLCKMMISPGVFFHLIFWVVREVKGQKIVQNDKKLYLSRSISKEPCIIWLSSGFPRGHWGRGVSPHPTIFLFFTLPLNQNWCPPCPSSEKHPPPLKGEAPFHEKAE